MRLPSPRRLHLPANVLVLGVAVVALVVSATGVAVAVTSTVTISDPTTSTNIAHVDSGGHLRVATQPGLNQPFAVAGYVNVGIDALTAPTSAALAVTRLGLSNTSGNSVYANSSFLVYLSAITVGSSGTCYDSDAVATLLPVREVLQVGANADVDLSGNPVAYKPPGTKKWCLGVYVAGDPTAPSSYFLPYATITGFVTSGTFSAGTTISRASGQPLATPAHPHPER